MKLCVLLEVNDGNRQDYVVYDFIIALGLLVSLVSSTFPFWLSKERWKTREQKVDFMNKNDFGKNDTEKS
ncbi:CLUMA_CG007154, isoform A [Clunio marinus]|uniref:CLUMA_CG007154, isoform A n=1 Tax=Clunio marinus TaxID=568069 RepID=A0A1J1HZU4_9DIPT|nr:CLUMA_CG007154, isoform A [Clunio marinus]